MSTRIPLAIVLTFLIGLTPVTGQSPSSTPVYRPSTSTPVYKPPVAAKASPSPEPGAREAARRYFTEGYSKVVDVESIRSMRHLLNPTEVGQLARDNMKAAQVSFGRAIELDPAYAEAYRMRAKTIAFLEFNTVAGLRKALADTDKAIELDPKLKDAHYDRAGLKSRIYAIDKSFTLDSILADLNKEIELYPTLKAGNARASIYVQMGRHDLARTDVEAVLKQVPDDQQALQLKKLIDVKLGTASSAPPAALDMDGYITKIQSESAAKKLDQAIATATECIAKFPRSVPCYAMRGELHLRAYKAKPLDVGRWKLAGKQDQEPEWLAAVADLTKAIAISPQNAELYYQRGLIYVEGYNSDPFELAIADANKTLALKPVHSGAKSLQERATSGYASSVAREANGKWVRAIALRGEGKDAEAAKVLNEGISEISKAIDVGPAYSRSINLNSRARMYRDMKKYDLAVADYSRAIELNTNYGDCYVERAEVYRSQKKYDLAMKDYETLLSRPDSTDTKYAKQRVPVGRADVYREQGKYDLAIAEYSKIVAADPQRQDAQWGLALSYHVKGDKRSAEAEFEKALAISWDPKALRAEILKLGVILAGTSSGSRPPEGTPSVQGKSSSTDAQAVFAAGIAYKKQGSHAAAKAEFTRAINLNPRDASSYYQRAFSNFSLKQYDAAIQDYTQSLAIDPTNKYAFNERGNTYFILDKFDLAIADFTKALTLDSRNTDFLNNRGYSNLRAGKIDAALADYAQSIAIDPNQIGPFVVRGNTFYALNKYDDAIKEYTKALAIDPRRVDILISRATTYKTANKPSLAMADSNAVLALEPGNRDANELKRSLGGTPVPDPITAATILGQWSGTMSADGEVIKSSFRFYKAGPTTAAAWTSSVAKGEVLLPTVIVMPEGSVQIRAVVNGDSIVFTGRLDPNRHKITGTFLLKPKEGDLAGSWVAERTGSQAAMNVQPANSAVATPGGIAFLDDFVDNRNKWATGETSEYISGVADGKYQLKTKVFTFYTTILPFESMPRIDQTKDFTIETEFTVLSGQPTYPFSLLWGVTRGFIARHAFGLMPNGTFFKGKSSEIPWAEQVPARISEAARTGFNVVNKLAVKKRGGSIELYVNDVFVAKTQFEAFNPDSSIGFQVNGDQTVSVNFLRIVQQ